MNKYEITNGPKCAKKKVQEKAKKKKKKKKKAPVEAEADGDAEKGKNFEYNYLLFDSNIYFWMIRVLFSKYF